MYNLLQSHSLVNNRKTSGEKVSLSNFVTKQAIQSGVHTQTKAVRIYQMIQCYETTVTNICHPSLTKTSLCGARLCVNHTSMKFLKMSETQSGKRTAPVGKSRSMEYRSLYPTTRLHQEGPALRQMSACWQKQLKFILIVSQWKCNQNLSYFKGLINAYKDLFIHDLTTYLSSDPTALAMHQ